MLTTEKSAEAGIQLELAHDTAPATIQTELERSEAGGYVPLTINEKQRSRALNRKFDRFLKEHEREYAERRMVIDSAANRDSTYKLTKRDLLEGALDWKLWGVLWCNILASIAPQGFTIFFPLVVKGLGYSGATA
jgi:hypothetical protein